jgi:hypothetical protein
MPVGRRRYIACMDAPIGLAAADDLELHVYATRSDS